VRYAWIKQHRDNFPIALMCRILKLSTSGYYEWLGRTASPRRRRSELIGQAAARSYFNSNRIYGYRKVHDDLKERDIKCCQETVRRIMRSAGLFSKVKRKFIATTDSTHNLAVAQNILDRDFFADAPDRKWASDITYIATDQGWLYLAAVMDLYSRKIIGWSMSQRIDAQLVENAFKMAISQRHPQPGLICHSDRGIQYASNTMQKLFSDYKIVCSMSRRGNCWDNACMESFFSSLKREWVYGKRYITREQARKDIFNYIEMFYNRIRKHATLGYVSPAAYEQRNGKNSKIAG
jgi:putative transposase